MSDLNNHGTNLMLLLFPRSSTDQNYITTCNVIMYVNSTCVYAGRVGFSSCPTSLLILDIKQLEPCMQCRAFKPMKNMHMQSATLVLILHARSNNILFTGNHCWTTQGACVKHAA